MTKLNHVLHFIFNDTLTQYLGYVCISDGDICISTKILNFQFWNNVMFCFTVSKSFHMDIFKICYHKVYCKTDYGDVQCHLVCDMFHLVWF